MASADYPRILLVMAVTRCADLGADEHAIDPWFTLFPNFHPDSGLRNARHVAWKRRTLLQQRHNLAVMPALPGLCGLLHVIRGLKLVETGGEHYTTVHGSVYLTNRSCLSKRYHGTAHPEMQRILSHPGLRRVHGPPLPHCRLPRGPCPAEESILRTFGLFYAPCQTASRALPVTSTVYPIRLTFTPCNR